LLGFRAKTAHPWSRHHLIRSCSSGSPRESPARVLPVAPCRGVAVLRQVSERVLWVSTLPASWLLASVPSWPRRSSIGPRLSKATHHHSSPGTFLSSPQTTSCDHLQTSAARWTSDSALVLWLRGRAICVAPKHQDPKRLAAHHRWLGSELVGKHDGGLLIRIHWLVGSGSLESPFSSPRCDCRPPEAQPCTSERWQGSRV